MSKRQLQRDQAARDGDFDMTAIEEAFLEDEAAAEHDPINLHSSPKTTGPLQGLADSGHSSVNPTNVSPVPASDEDSFDPDDLPYFQQQQQHFPASRHNQQQQPNQEGGQLEKEEDPADFYSFGDEEQQYVRQFKTVAVSFTINFNNMENNSDTEGTLRDAIDKAIDKGFELGGDEAKVGVQISHPGQDPTKGPLLVKFCYKDQLTTDKVFNELEKTLQSNSSWIID